MNMFKTISLFSLIFHSQNTCTAERYPSKSDESSLQILTKASSAPLYNEEATQRITGMIDNIPAACREERAACIRKALEEGANPNTLLYDPQAKLSLLHFIVQVLPNVPLIRLLLSKGGDADPRNCVGYTPLMFIDHSDLSLGEEMLTTLIEGKADINAANKEGRTALALASFWQRPNAIENLLKKGALANIVTPQGETAYSEALILPQQMLCSSLEEQTSLPDLQNAQRSLTLLESHAREKKFTRAADQLAALLHRTTLELAKH